MIRADAVVRPRPALGAVAVLSALALLGCASTQPAETQANDVAIKTEVLARIAADPDTNPFEIEVEVNEGVVHLTGVVDEAADRAEAERIAREVDGVSRVINDLEVGDQTLGERLDDGTITARVKAKLAAEPSLNPFNITVNTVEGVVSLMGRVNNQEEKAEAERLARATSGVQSVRNLIEVGDLD